MYYDIYIEHLTMNRKKFAYYEIHPVEPTTKVNLKYAKKNDYQFIDFIQIQISKTMSFST
jgi:hypothetical protein